MVDDVELTERTMAEEIWQRLVDTTAPARRAGYLNGLDHMALITREELETALDEAARTPSPVSVEELIELLELGGDYGADVFNGFRDKTGPCAKRVEANVERFNKAVAALSARP